MLDKLQELEQVLAQITSQYHVVATELANLKNKPSNEAKYEATIGTLTDELDLANKRIGELQQSLQNQNKELSNYAQKIELLTQENAKLHKDNHDIKQKNAIAIERAELIQTWLRHIDNGTKPTTEGQ